MNISNLTEAELYVRLTQSTPITERQWRDALTLSPIERAETIQDWLALADMTWTKRPSVMEDVAGILGALVAIANPVTTIAGGVTGVVGLVAALKAL